MGGEMIELLVLIVLAGLVLYRLKSVLGTRTGHEGQPEILRRKADAERRKRDRGQAEPAEAGAEIVPMPLPDRDEDDEEDLAEQHLTEASRAALAKVRTAEPGFDLDGFVDGARGAYEMILMAYEEGDRDTLQSLLAPDVFQAFEQGIKSRETAGLRVDARFIGVREARVEEIAFEEDSNIADVTVRFVGELITAVRDAENRVVEGDPNDIRRQSDQWTFSREMGSVDPNWLLTGTGG